MKFRGARAAAGAGLLLQLCACATPGPSRTYFLEDSYARYYAADSGRTLRVERDGMVLDVTCLPLELAQDKPLASLPRVMCPDAKIPILGQAHRAGADWDLREFEVTAPTGRCRPLFSSPGEDERAAGRPRSCWNRLWEVPAALIVYPVAIVVLIGAASAPIWAPLLFFR